MERSKSNEEHTDDALLQPVRAADRQLQHHANMVSQAVSRAVRRHDASKLWPAWEALQAFARRRQNIEIPLQLYEQVMYAFISLRDKQQTFDIWGQMVDAGIEPAAKTFTIMMRGAHKARDPELMEQLWEIMRKRCKPDGFAWSTRVFGLFRNTRTDRGFEALSEMSRDWINAARRMAGEPNADALAMVKRFSGAVDGVERPDLVVMNSAISGAAGSKDQSAIATIIKWGQSFGIEFDIVTYNVLLNLSMQHRKPDQALGLLKRMQEKGVNPDSSTWTVLLTAMFEGDFMSGSSAEEQTKAVITFMDSVDQTLVESGGSGGIDAKAYALAMDRLLKLHNNPVGAQAVLAHMTDKGLKPTTHVYTVLMTSYFQQTPPDIEAVERLWHHLQTADQGRGAAVDAIFYDRLVEGYAQHHNHVGSTAPVMRFLERMTSEGKNPSWRALRAAAQCLADRGEWDNLKRLVSDVRARLQTSNMNNIRFGQEHFWRFILETGILQGEGITSVNDILNHAGIELKSPR